MATKTGIEIVDATLSNKSGSTIKVRLQLTTKSLTGQQGVEDTTVARAEFARGYSAPDGEYTVEYFYLRPYQMPCRVQRGIIMSAVGQ
ncbi:MAG TPA: hypothetical protein VLV89_00330 [Candidatus Acidoferrum sp.]|nr:hypothetical protein [Candidatus Acidoferrum sp.]